LKSKVYVIGPNFSGKTTFTHKIFGRNYELFKYHIIESETPPDNIDDAMQIYLLLPDRQVLKERGCTFTDEDEEKYMQFYYKNANSTVIVKDF
jgi:GTPase SAR1 family protein